MGVKQSKRTRARVVLPKMTNVVRPAGMSLEEWQISLRQQAAQKEAFDISERNAKYCPGEYVVRNGLTRSEYKVVYRGKESPWNYCSCMDFKVSGLGTCKHLEAVKEWTKSHRKKVFCEEPAYSSVYVDYKGTPRVRIRIGQEKRVAFEALAPGYFDRNGVLRKGAYTKFDSFLKKAKELDASFRCYDDALDIILGVREKVQRSKMMSERYPDCVLDTLLTSKLYPYQKEGVRFAVGAGKAVIADEMGLGKTIQAIASAEIYLREGMASSVLVVCPTTLKYQWKREIEKFTGSDTVESSEDYIVDDRIRPKVVVVEGNPSRRRELYKCRAPYKVVSYHTLTNDIRANGGLSTDVLIMDEIQRLKNWNTLISKAARKIDSRWAILLSGTPLENKLEELFANMELVDQFCLGPYYLFRDKHILTDASTGKIMGYRNLNSIGDAIRGRLIRRTKSGVKLQLPKRSDQYVLVPMTEEQTAMHTEFNWDLSMLLHKYEKYHFITEQDRKRILLLLAKMRMVADSTFILEQDLETRRDVKIDELMNILQDVLEGGTEKVVVFSEWERMTRLVAMELEKRGIRFEYLNGSIPSKKRGELVHQFTTLPESRVFISTDAGSTGLNLQVASILVNLDLPWNPAVLEQRIARIYRLGQENPVQIINLVSQKSIEEGMIQKLRFKTSMFEGVLDGGADSVFVSEDKFKKFMEDVQSVVKETPVVEYTEEASADVSAEEGESLEKAVAPGNGVGCIQQDVLAEDGIPEDELPKESAAAESAVGQSGGTAAPEGVNASAGQGIPRDLLAQGVSFLNGLAQTLKSPEATKDFVDSIVEIDKNTGESSIRIPVKDRDTVLELFSLVGKLLKR